MNLRRGFVKVRFQFPTILERYTCIDKKAQSVTLNHLKSKVLRDINGALAEAKGELEESQRLFAERKKLVEEYGQKVKDAIYHAHQLCEIS